MSKNIPLNYDYEIKYLVIMSLIGLLLALMLTVYSPKMHENLFWRKPLIGSIFGLICAFGILAVFFPKRCSSVFYFRKKKSIHPNLGKFPSHGTSSSLQGHHPICGNFDAHVFRVGYKTFCAACTGLLLGGFSALAGTLVYFFCEWDVGWSSSLMVWMGVLGVGSGLFQFKFRSFVRISLNAIFVLGTLFVLIGVDGIVHSVTVDLFLVASTLFWLFTRISLSQWDHERICSACEVATCQFAYIKKSSSFFMPHLAQ